MVDPQDWGYKLGTSSGGITLLTHELWHTEETVIAHNQNSLASKKSEIKS